ncbi:hypothetical protein [Streptosporangium sp. H16]|uniref:hypothetical protein n=1 Tax=Streptosporangium sp. H16 TaxID=3444184 RepID=UPI003F7ACEFE
MERARQLVGEMLIYCFAVVLLTGGFLAFFYNPGSHLVVYDGSYAPLQGVPMSAAYNSALEINFEVRGGLLVRQLHHTFSVLLVTGAVVWTLLGKFRYVFALLGLGLAVLCGLSGYGAVDDLLSGTVLGRLPTPWWYGLHLLAALGLGAVLVISSRREAARHPRTLRFVALSLGLTVLVVFFL